MSPSRNGAYNKDKKVVIVWARSVLEARLLRVANTLDDEGYTVEIFAWDRESDKDDLVEHEHFNCHYLHMKAPYNSPFLFVLLPLWWLMVLGFLLRRGPRAVHACDMDCLLPTLLYCRLRGVPLIYDIFDIYGSMVRNTLPGFICNILIRLEAAGARASDAVLLVNELQYEHLGRPGLRRHLFLINAPDEPDWEEIRVEMKKVEVAIPREGRGKNIIFYGGSLEYARRFDQLLKAIEGLDEVFHVVAGSGADAERLIPMFRRSGNTHYIGPIPFKQVIAWSRLASIIYVLCDAGTEKCRMGSQTRLFVAMMCGRPLVVTASINAADIVEGAGCGLTVPDGDIEALRDAIRRLAGSPSLRASLGRKGQAAYEKRYGWSKLKKGLLDLYADLLE